MSRMLRVVGLVAFDRPCPKCRYNLRGLKIGGRCPECGHPISRPPARFIDALADAPMHYLKTLAVGLMLLAVAGVGGAASMGLARSGHGLHGSAWAVTLSLAWWVGTWIVTRPRPHTENTLHDTLLDSQRLRVAVRISQLAWPGAAAGWLLVALAPILTPGPAPIAGAVVLVTPSPLENFGRRLALIAEPIGFLSIVPLSLLLSSLAEWAADSPLAERFRASAWGIAVGGGLGVVGLLAAGSAGTIMGVIGIMGMVTLALAMLALVIFVIGLVQLAVEAVWAVSNAHNRLAVEARLAARREAEFRRMDRRNARAEAARRKAGSRATPPPTSFPARGPGITGEPVFKRPAGGVEPYGVAPDEPPRA